MTESAKGFGNSSVHMQNSQTHVSLLDFLNSGTIICLAAVFTLETGAHVSPS